MSIKLFRGTESKAQRLSVGMGIAYKFIFKKKPNRIYLSIALPID